MARDTTSTSLAERLERELADAGIALAIDHSGDTFTLAGPVGSEEEREAALDIAFEILGNRFVIEEEIEVRGMPLETQNADLSTLDVAGFRGADPDLEEDESVIPGDFTDQDTLRAPQDAQGAALSDEDIRLGEDRADLVSDGDQVYVPPTDPVGSDTEILGGFSRSSLDDLAVERSSDGTIGDEAIRDAVLRELREDAATTGLAVTVEVTNGVVRLGGTVDDLDDVESAEEVAARVPGVAEVVEDFEVTGLTDT